MLNHQDNKLSHIRKTFTVEEDIKLRQMVEFFGDKSWKAVASQIPGRTAKQCRERYHAYLAPNIVQTPWTHEEDTLILEKYDEYGPKWSLISKHLKNRSDNQIKNRFNNHLSRMQKQKKQIKLDNRLIVNKVEPMLHYVQQPVALTETGAVVIPQPKTVFPLLSPSINYNIPHISTVQHLIPVVSSVAPPIICK